MNYKDMTIDDIIQWCQENGKDKVDWLKATAAKTFPKEDGTTRKITFIELKLEFVREFMADIAPKAKPKKPSMFDKIGAL